MMTENLSAADIAAITKDNDGMFGGNGWGIILLALLFGWGRGGFGGGADAQYATNAEVQRGFNQQTTNQQLNGIANGISSLGYDQLAQMKDLSNTVQNVGHDTQNAVQQAQFAAQQSYSALQAEINNCCCTTQRSIDGVNYNMAQGFCGVNNTINNATRDIVDNQNQNTQRIIDQITGFRMEDMRRENDELRSQVQALNLAQSQSNQNAYLINQLRPCPVPAYPVANPYASCPTGCYGYTA